MISLTLLYSTILPLLLQLILGIWQGTGIATDHDDHLVKLSVLSPLLDRLPEAARVSILASINDMVDLWNRTDLIWAGTRLLGGMSAAFGLRVILPTRPIETTAIVLAGWAASDMMGRIARHICDA